MLRIRLATAVSMLAACGAMATAQSQLRYRFEVGQQYLYERQEVVAASGGAAPGAQSIAQIRAWCLRREGPEMLLLIELARRSRERFEPACGALLYLDESGRRRIPDESATRLGPLDPALDVLPMLPLTAQPARAWTTPHDLYGRQWRCADRGPDGVTGHVRVDFIEEDSSGVADVLGQSRTGRFRFDPVAGHVTRLEIVAWDEPAKAQTAALTTLRQTASHTPGWTARRADEADRFLRTLRHEDRLLAELLSRPDDCAQILVQLDRLWAAFASEIEGQAGSPFAALVDARRLQLGADADTLRARAAVAGRWLHQPARRWTLQDAGGRTVVSEVLRQGAVIECFWSAESLWGLRALRSLDYLPRAPGAPPLRVISYNMDFNIAVARRAIERCGGGWTHILGGPLQDVEELPEFPVVRVLDERGVVRGIWIGWEPTYAAAAEMARELGTR